MFLYYHSQFFVLCRFSQIYLGKNSELFTRSHQLFFSDIDLYYHVVKYCTFLMNHPINLLTRSTTVTRYFKFHFFKFKYKKKYWWYIETITCHLVVHQLKF